MDLLRYASHYRIVLWVRLTTKAFESPNTAVQLINVMRQGVLLGKKAQVKWGDKG
jgi:hypothetical protein